MSASGSSHRRLLRQVRQVVQSLVGTGTVGGSAGAGGAQAGGEPSLVGREKEGVIAERLAANGGEMPQKQLVEDTEWAKSTVSKHLREMERAGDVVRVKAGREKIVYLPEAAPADEKR